jgi:CubicO group peptidase (beta-lactamase class C family)
VAVTHPNVAARTPQHDSWFAPGFEAVAAECDRNFLERGEIGAAVAAYWRGEKVVDLWGGRCIPTGDAPWNQDRMVMVSSTTKGLEAMTIAIANSRGWIDHDARVAVYWPEFAQNGKEAVTVRQLLSHEAVTRSASQRCQTCMGELPPAGPERSRSRLTRAWTSSSSAPVVTVGSAAWFKAAFLATSSGTRHARCWFYREERPRTLHRPRPSGRCLR